jgi:4-methylaminobutanoate oxidase (formaldehyde-forming)
MTPVSLPDHAEVVVVGAGVLGSATAFHLAGMGRNVLLLERGPLGSETSSQGAGFLCAIRPRESSARIVRYSTEFYRRFREETGFDIDLHLTGGLRVALSRGLLASLHDEAATGRSIGVDVQELSPAELADRAPGFLLDGAVGGTFTPLEGYVTATRDAAIGLARGAARRGATVRTSEEVRSITPRSGGFDVEAQSGRVQAETVVLATNAALVPLLRRVGVPLGGYPIHHQCAVYDIPSGIDPRLPTIRIGERDLYLRHEVGGLLVGGVGADPSSPAPDARDSAFELAEVRPDAAGLVAMRERAAAFVPEIATAIVIREQRGLAVVAPDLEPLLGEVLPRLFVIAADLRGIQSGPGLGLMLAQLVATGECEWDASPYRPDRFGDLARDPDAIRAAATAGLQPAFYRTVPA